MNTKSYWIDALRMAGGVLQLARKLGSTRYEVYRQLKSFDIKAQDVKFDHYFFQKIDSEEKAYWLGFLYADGCVANLTGKKQRMTLKLSIRDAEHLEKFKTSLKCYLKTHKSADNVFISMYSSRLCNDLIENGCIPKKSLSLKFPTTVPSYLIRHFIRGYFDGDGCAIISGKNLRMNMVGTEDFLNEMQDVLNRELGVSKTKLSKPSNAYAWDKKGNIQVRKIANWMYDDAKIYLPRKMNILFEL